MLEVELGGSTVHQPNCLLRFDDLCPTMDRAKWEEIESVVFEFGLRPIAAVVPDNRDPGLQIDPPDERFWDRVRTWQSKGWAIAMHGYQHVYVTDVAGLVGLNPRSEFAGLPREEQEAKLRAGIEIFAHEGVRPTVWVAPAHSFDVITVEVLRDLEIHVISDGLYLLPHRDRDGMLWIPQQLWRFRAMPVGVWTICSHPNSLTREGVRDLLRDIGRHRSRITDVDAVTRRYSSRERGLLDALAPPALRWMKIAKGRPSAWFRKRRSGAPYLTNGRLNGLEPLDDGLQATRRGEEPESPA